MERAVLAQLASNEELMFKSNLTLDLHKNVDKLKIFWYNCVNNFYVLFILERDDKYEKR